jgi:hypothetical protein
MLCVAKRALVAELIVPGPLIGGYIVERLVSSQPLRLFDANKLC